MNSTKYNIFKVAPENLLKYSWEATTTWSNIDMFDSNIVVTYSDAVVKVIVMSVIKDAPKEDSAFIFLSSFLVWSVYPLN